MTLETTGVRLADVLGRFPSSLLVVELWIDQQGPLTDNSPAVACNEGITIVLVEICAHE
jgi:hypothetical protein